MKNIFEQYDEDKNKLEELFDYLKTSRFIPCQIENKRNRLIKKWI